jgi:ribose 5-phosphate isomerase B
MIIAIGCDHGGWALKSVIIEEVRQLGHTVIDCGAHTLDPGDDYPDFTREVAGAVHREEAARGIVVCAAFAPRSATTPIRPIRASSTTT